MRRASLLALASVGALAPALGGCGLTVRAADLFVLQRVGGAGALTLLVSDAGTVRCDTAAARALPDALLLAARDLAADLDKDAQAGLRLPARAGSVYSYSVKLQDGTVSFADTAARGHPELGRAELLAAQIAQQACGLPG